MPKPPLSTMRMLRAWLIGMSAGLRERFNVANPSLADRQAADRARAAKLDQDPARSPHIAHASWGHMTVEGYGSGKDFKVWPGGAREWDWTETHTHHVPGIRPADVQELLDHGCEVIVLSRGMWLRLRTTRETLQLLESRGVEVRLAETLEAVKLYNQLASSGAAVGGLFHSTC